MIVIYNCRMNVQLSYDVSDCPSIMVQEQCKKSSHRSVFELGNMQTNSSCIFHHIVIRDSGMTLFKSTVLLLLKDEIYRFHVHMSVRRKYISKMQPTRCNIFSICLFL